MSVSERATFFNQAVYNVLIYIIFISVQLAVILGLSQYYIASVHAECISNQTLVLAFYRNEFLHSLLPFEDIGLWIRNVLLVLSLAFANAEFPYRHRRHKYTTIPLALVMYTVVYFDQGIGALANVITTVIITLMIAGEVAYTLTRKDKEAETDEQAD